LPNKTNEKSHFFFSLRNESTLMATSPGINRTASGTTLKKPTAIKEGWLKKKMQKRYFTIEGITLSWYDKPLVSI
jgi:hypothetical protein